MFNVTQITRITQIRNNILFRVVHVLGVAGIYNDYGVAIDDVGIIPLAFVGHITAFPSGNGRFPSQKCLFNLEDGIIGIVSVLMHQLLGVRMLVLLGDIAIKRDYLLDTTFLDNVLHIFAYSSRIAA